MVYFEDKGWENFQTAESKAVVLRVMQAHRAEASSQSNESYNDDDGALHGHGFQLINDRVKCG